MENFHDENGLRFGLIYSISSLRDIVFLCAFVFKYKISSSLTDVN